MTVSDVIACEEPPSIPEEEQEEEKEETEEEEAEEKTNEQVEEEKRAQATEEQQQTQQAPQAEGQVPFEKDEKEDEEKEEVATSSSIPLLDSAETSPSINPPPAPPPARRPSTVDSAPSKPSRSIVRGARPPALDLQGAACRRTEKFATSPASFSQPKPPEGSPGPAKSLSPKARLPLLRAPPKSSDDDNRICKNMDDLKTEELALLRSVIDEETGQGPAPTPRVQSPRSSVHSIVPPVSRSPRSLLRRLGSTSPPPSTSSVTHDPARERLWREVFELDKSPTRAAVAKSPWAEIEPGELSQVSTASPRSLEHLGDESPRVTLAGLVGGGYPFRRRGNPQSLEPLQVARSARFCRTTSE